MGQCECMPDCLFFEGCLARNAIDFTESVKETYCRADFEKCARYQVFKARGAQHIPDLMTPTETNWAREIVTACPV